MKVGSILRWHNRYIYLYLRGHSPFVPFNVLSSMVDLHYRHGAHIGQLAYVNTLVNITYVDFLPDCFVLAPACEFRIVVNY